MASGEGSASESGRQPAPGWYPDPVDSTGLRYWDGERWTVEQAPNAATAGQSAAPAAAAPPRRLGTAQWLAIAGVALVALVSLADLVVSLQYANELNAQLSGDGPSLEEATNINDAFGVVGLLYGLSMLAAAVVFIVWFHRAYSNAAGLTGQKLRWGTGWAVGGWFVPILWWWRPKQIANDIWRAGDPKSKGNPEWNALPVSGLVHWWWALYLLAGVIGGVGSALISTEAVLVDAVNGFADVTDSDLRQERAGANLTAAGAAFNLIAATAAVMFIRQSSRRQDERIGAPASQ